MKAAKKTLIIGIGVISVLGLTALGLQAYQGFWGGGKMEAVVDLLTYRLSLDDNQRAQLTAIASEIKQKAVASRAGREAGHKALVDLVRQANLDRQKLDAMIRDRQQHMNEFVQQVAERLVEFHAGLTPEQREKLAHAIENHKMGNCFGPSHP